MKEKIKDLILFLVCYIWGHDIVRLRSNGNNFEICVRCGYIKKIDRIGDVDG